MTDHGLALRCQDPTLRRALEQWLEDLRLYAPAGLTLDVRVAEGPLPHIATPVFEQPDVRFGPGPDGLRVEWTVAPAVAEIPLHGKVATIRLSNEAVTHLDQCTRTFLMAVVIVLLRRAGWFHLHAATANDPEGRGWLVAGNAHAGKSTTAALLAASGWQVGTDDAAWVEQLEDQVRVHTCHAPIALRDGGRRLLARAGGMPLLDRGKVGYWPEDLGGVWTPLVTPQIVIFTTVGSARTTAVPVSRPEALSELVRWSAWVMLEPEVAQRHLDALAALTGQARCYRVRLGRDLFSRPNRLIELVT
jgi:hypothetical protein